MRVETPSIVAPSERDDRAIPRRNVAGNRCSCVNSQAPAGVAACVIASRLTLPRPVDSNSKQDGNIGAKRNVVWQTWRAAMAFNATSYLAGVGTVFVAVV